MADISIRKSDIPLWSGGTGSLAIDIGARSPDSPLVPAPGALLAARFQLEAGHGATLGPSSTLSLGVKAETSVTLAPLWRGISDDGIVAQYGLAAALQDDNLILAWRLGAAAEASAAGTFRYGVLSAGASLEAGAHAGFVATRTYPRTLALRPMLADFFAHLRLPCDVDAPPGPGEVVALEYDGYLKLGATVSAGYEVKGTQHVEVSQLRLAEHYGLSVVGKLAVSAGLAGSFAVELRAADDPHFVRVSVRRWRASELRVAADVGVEAQLVSAGLPRSGQEFLGALLGVQAKSWLNLLDSVVDQAGQIRSLDDLKAKLDGLAGDFVAKWLGKTIDEVTSVQEVAATLARVKSVVDSYRNLDNAAVTLFDRFYDPVTAKVGQLETHLQRLLDEVTSWDLLPGNVEPELWRVVQQLTDGDPLAWVLGKVDLPGRPGADSLQEFRQRIHETLALIRDDAHAEIRRVIAVAKEHFPLDHFLNQLDALDSPAKLKAVANTAVGHFVTRLVGRAVDATLSETEWKKIARVVQEVARKKDGFWKAFDNALQAAARQNLSLSLHAEYARADEHTALVELDVRLVKDDGSPCIEGRRLVQAVGRGDLAAALSEHRPDLARLRGGRLAHSLLSRSAVTINVVGWHLDWRYSDVHSLLVGAEQRIEPAGGGLVNVYTAIEMNDDRARRRGGESLHVNFLLRFLGETRGAVAPDPDSRQLQYLIDVLTGFSARYKVELVDASTTPGELDEYLALARDLGLDSVGASAAGLAPLLELRSGSYGRLEASYDVRYTEAGLKALFAPGAVPVSADDVRRVLRRVILAGYGHSLSHADVAWAFNSPAVLHAWEADPNNFAPAGVSPRAFDLDADPGVMPATRGPARVQLNAPLLRLLDGLFRLQTSVVSAFERLQELLTSGTRIAPDAFETRLRAFGQALDQFDGQDMHDNTLFAVFDELVRLHTPGAQARASSLTLKTQVQGAERTLVFMLQPQP